MPVSPAQDQGGEMWSGKVAPQFDREGNIRQSVFPSSGHQPVPSLCFWIVAVLLKMGMSSPRISKGCLWTTQSHQHPGKKLISC